MKKRILSVLIMSAMVLSMVGCNGSTEAPQTTTEDSETTTATTTTATNEDVTTETTTAADTEESTAEITTASTTTTTTAATTTTTAATTTTTTTIVEEPEISEELPIISGINSYHDNHIYFYVNEPDRVSYTYNLDENVMCKNGYGIIDGNMHIMDEARDYGRLPLYNLITKEFYEYHCLGNCDGYNFVWKEESDFDGAAYYFGILDSNGEWALPLSSDYAICDFIEYFAGVYQNRYSFDVAFRTDSSFCFYAHNGGSYDAYSTDIITYNWKTDTLSYKADDPALIELAYGYTIYTEPVLYNDSILVCHDYTCYMYNINTGEFTQLFDAFYLSYCGDGVYIRYSDGQYTILGKNFEKLYDITGYTINTDNLGNLCIDATENYAAFEAEGADGKSYTIIIDKDGNRIVDPISDTGLIAMSGDYVITESEVINCKTGERKAHSFEEICDEYRNTVNIVDKYGRVMVYSDGGCYFIDPADPDTLINPFEIVDKIYTLE